MQNGVHDKNAKTLKIILLVVAGMVALAFASVPLYDMFCRATGFGGTTMVAKELPDTVLDREVRIKFDANTMPGMEWNFKPEKYEETVRLGQQGIIAFLAKNDGATPTAGTAVYNVTPEKVGKYFRKIQCFCFTEQILKPGQEMQMPVLFFIDPEMNKDRDMEDVKTITLSYTFFPSDSEALDKAMEAFYNTP